MQEQITSYEAQKTYYTQKIGENPDWELAGIFADKGLSGTSMKKRDNFNKMIAAASGARSDTILTKSLSRFARNTVDCLETVRMLKAHGIGVIFEKENINTLTESSEFLITLFSGFAQAESESISKNIVWGKEESKKAGKVPFQYKKLLGYRKGPDGKPEIDPQEAETVRRIYRRYLDGCSLPQIQRELEADHVPTAQAVQRWSYQVIRNILTNERYIGDAMLGKTFVTDCISKRVKKNNGERGQSYVENNHPAIIPRELFYRVQEEMTRPGQQAEGDAENRQDGAGQILRQIRPLRAAGVRGMRDPLQAGDLGQEREKADRVAVCLPAGVRDEILPQLPHTGRGEAAPGHPGCHQRVCPGRDGGEGGSAGLHRHGLGRRRRGDQPHGSAAEAEGHHRPASPAAGTGAGKHGG